MALLHTERYFDKVTLSTPGYREITERVVELTEKKSYARVLDVGDGTGRIALKLARSVFKVVVVDKSTEILKKICEKARKKHADNIQILNKDITKDSFLWPLTTSVITECEFTSILCSFVLHRCDDKWKTIILRELRKSLVIGGQMIITDVDPARVSEMRRRVEGIYRKLVVKKEGALPAAVMIRSALSRLARDHFLSDRAWEDLLKKTGYRDIANERIADLLLVHARNPG